MRQPKSVQSLEDFGRSRLSANFFMRDFLYSEIANVHQVQNIPEDPALAIRAGTRLCETLLEPLQATFGRIAIRSAYRSRAVNAFGNDHGFSCASNAANAAGHIWDMLDADGCMGATACIVVPWFADRFTAEGDWTRMAWWIHDHLPYSKMLFFPKLWAFNLSWHEKPQRRIDSYATPKGCLTKPGILTKPGMANHYGDHRAAYAAFPPFAFEAGFTRV